MEQRLPKSYNTSESVKNPPAKLELKRKTEPTVYIETEDQLEFGLFLDLMLTHKDWVCVSSEVGDMCKRKDSGERRIHVEYLAYDNKLCKVWRIGDWRTSDKRRQIVVDAQNRDNEEAAILRAKERKLREHLEPLFDKNTLNTIIRLCIQKPEIAKQQWGIEL